MKAQYFNWTRRFAVSFTAASASLDGLNEASISVTADEPTLAWANRGNNPAVLGLVLGKIQEELKDAQFLGSRSNAEMPAAAGQVSLETLIGGLRKSLRAAFPGEAFAVHAARAPRSVS